MMTTRSTSSTNNSPGNSRPNKCILVVRGDRNAKTGKGAQAHWVDISRPYCNLRKMTDFMEDSIKQSLLFFISLEYSLLPKDLTIQNIV